MKPLRRYQPISPYVDPDILGNGECPPGYHMVEPHYRRTKSDRYMKYVNPALVHSYCAKNRAKKPKR